MKIRNSILKKFFKTLKYILFFTLFIICMSPALLVQLTTGHIDPELAQLYLERRMQAMGLFVGVGLISGGLIAVKRRKIILRSRLFRDKKLLEVTGSDFEVTGKDAFNYGIELIAIGIVATVWSLFFWVKHVIPVIF